MADDLWCSLAEKTVLGEHDGQDLSVMRVLLGDVVVWQHACPLRQLELLSLQAMFDRVAPQTEAHGRHDLLTERARQLPKREQRLQSTPD